LIGVKAFKIYPSLTGTTIHFEQFSLILNQLQQVTGKFGIIFTVVSNPSSFHFCKFSTLFGFTPEIFGKLLLSTDQLQRSQMVWKSWN